MSRPALTAAAAVYAVLQATQAAAAENESERPALQEVVVTAGKMGEQRLQDIPASITVLDQTRIEDAGIDDFLDYVRTVPGLGFQIKSAAGGRDDIRGGRRLNLRGIESGYDSVPTTAFYLDDTPVPVMDPKLFDVQRIEVLRGPQGTLYGANSMGGTIRVVMNKPVMNKLDYAGDVSVSTTHKGAESYDLDGMINIPLVTDRVALRAVSFYRDDGGYVDHVLTPAPSVKAEDVERDINGEKSWGVRLTAGIEVTPRLTITPGIFRQQTRVADAGMYEPDFQDLGRYFMSMHPDNQENDFTLYTLEASYAITDRLQLFSSSSYFDSSFFGFEDSTKGFFDFGGPSYGEASYLNTLDNDRLGQELRLAYNGERWRGVVGAFYMDEDRVFDQYGTTDATGVWFTYYQTNGDKQFALFGEGTYDLTDKLKLTAGARWFDGKQGQYTHYVSTLDDPANPYIEDFSGKASASAFSPKVQVSYEFTGDKMVYVSAAKGFRPGGPTSLVPETDQCLADLAQLGLSRPRTEFDPDTLWSYELGTKSSFADRRITTNVALYYIDWKQVQQTASLNCGFTFVGNVGAAQSKGAELEFWARPTDALEISGTFGYTDAKFMKTEPAVGVVEGDRLPLVPKVTGSVAVQYSFAMPTGNQSYIRADYQYISSSLEGSFYDFERPSYGSVDLRLGVGLTDHTEMSMFVENLTDVRPVMSIEEEIFYPDEGGVVPSQFTKSISTVRPRTFGVMFRYRN
jgi:outer membrane receptor protein involved in Fe transport